MLTAKHFLWGIALIASLFTHPATAQLPVSSHKIYINGQQHTNNETALDILGDGTMSYDMETRTLTLNNVNLTNAGKTAAIEFKDN